MPLYSYQCQDCGASLEILHGRGKKPDTCGLDCPLQGPGSFGKGKVVQLLDAANINPTQKSLSVSSKSLADSISNVHREALRQKGLRKLGGELTERDLDKLRDGGVTVYRRDGAQTWGKDGGDEAAPSQLGTGSES